MSDNPKHLFEAAFDCNTEEAFKAELERGLARRDRENIYIIATEGESQGCASGKRAR